MHCQHCGKVLQMVFKSKPLKKKLANTDI